MSSSSSSSSPTVQNCSLLKEDPLFGAKNESRAEFGLERVLVIVGLLSVFVVVLGLPLGVWFVRREKIKKKRGRKQDDWRKQLERSLEHIFRLWAKNNKIEKKKHFLNKSSWLLCGSGRGGDDDGIGIDGSASSTNFLRNSIFGSFSMRRSGGSAATSFSSQCITEGTEIDQVPLVFVFTDIENSTLLSDTNPTVYREVQEAHDLVMRDNLDEFCGYEINTEGDSFQCCFEKCSHAVLFCEKVQEDLLSYEWSKKVCNLPGLGEMTSYVQKHQMASDRVETVWKGPRVRMGIHASSTKNNCYRMEKKATGSLEFSGPAFEVTHEVESAASGGQILLTQHALDLGRQEEEIFHVSTFHLGTFVLRCGFEVNLYQARPSRGALSYRSFPLLRIEQSAPGRGLNTLKAPEGSICFVCLRLDQQGKKQKGDEDDGARSSTLRRRFTDTKKNSRNNNNKKNSFWSTLSSSLRYQLESSLRMWMQQFGGYEVCLPDSDVLLVTFSNKETAIRFCMATQIALLLESWSKDVTSQPHMKDVYTDNKVRDKYIYRGPRLAIALLSCNGDEYSSSRPPSLRYQPSKVCSKVQQQPPLPPLGGEEGEERSVKRVQNSVLLMRMAAPLFMSGEKTKIGQCMANSKAWYDHYPATACSRYCGTDISPSSYLGKKHLVFFFYFTNKTLGCAFEAKYFRDFHHLFASAGAEVIGVSLDSTESQAAFSSGLRLPYPLICDTPGGLHALFGSFDISMLMRRTYVVSSSGMLVSSFETTLGIDGKGYPHVMSALEKVQELYSNALSLHQTQYCGEPVDLCEKVCKRTKGGHITYIQQSCKSANLAELWKNLPSRGGPSRPSIVDLGTHQVEEKDPLVSLFGIEPSMLSGRYSERNNFTDAASPMHRTLRAGAFDAPNPNHEVALVFTFPVDLQEINNSMKKAQEGAYTRVGSVPHSLVWSLLTLQEKEEEQTDDHVEEEEGEEGEEKMTVKNYCKIFRKIAKAELRSYRGYESQEVGSGNFMLAFPDISLAASWCAMVQLKLCMAMEERIDNNSSMSESLPWGCDALGDIPFGVKMGISFGKPTYGKPHSRTGRQDYFGSVVNLAARTASCAKPGQILLSKPKAMLHVHQQQQRGEYLHAGVVRGVKIDLEFRDKGEMAFKGFKNKQAILEVVALKSHEPSGRAFQR